MFDDRDDDLIEALGRLAVLIFCGLVIAAVTAACGVWLWRTM